MVLEFLASWSCERTICVPAVSATQEGLWCGVRQDGGCDCDIDWSSSHLAELRFVSFLAVPVHGLRRNVVAKAYHTYTPTSQTVNLVPGTAFA